MKGYKHKLKEGEDKILAQWINQQVEKKGLGINEKHTACIFFISIK